MSPKDVRNQVNRALASERKALRGTLARLTEQRVMLAQVLGVAGEVFQDAEVMQQAGLRSKPLAGATMVVLPLHGRSAHGVVIACANGALHVANMQDGETALFNEKEGHFIHLKNGKVIRIECDKLEVVAALATFSGNVQIDGNQSTAGSTTVAGDVTAGGNIKDQGGAKSMAGMRQVFNGHTHNEHDGPQVSAPNQLA